MGRVKEESRGRLATLQDILADGGIDYETATLTTFDFVIASIHSRFGMSRDEMSERILRALGRIIGRKLAQRRRGAEGKT